MRILSLVFLLVWTAALTAEAAAYVPYPPHEARKSLGTGRSHLSALDTVALHSYDMQSLALNYRVSEGYDPMTGTASLTLTALENLQVIPFNCEGITVYAVREAGQLLPFTVHGDTLYVTRPLAADANLTLDFDVAVTPQPNFVDEGYVSGGTSVWTFSEPYAARRWYPCWDQPSDKFSQTTVSLNMPYNWSLASNGELLSTSYPETGRKLEIYQNPNPISSYLVMLAASDYAKTVQTVNGVEFRYFVWRQDSARAAYDWGRTPEMVQFFSDHFGPYPFQEYGMVEAAIGNGWTCMEHQTFTTMGFNILDGTRYWEGVVAHELTHQWFGDDLSPVDFRNMWLNEGFATYGSVLWAEHTEGQVAMLQTLQGLSDSYLAEDRVERYAMYDPPPDYLFGAVIYNKGAWVLHMLREQLLGDTLFFQALHNYTAAHHFGTVNTNDFIASVDSTTGQDLRWFFNQWVYQAGHPVLDITVSPNQPTANDVTVHVRQLQTNAPLFRLPIVVDVTINGQTIVRQFWFDQTDQSVTQNFDSPVQAAVMDTIQPLLYEGTGAGASEPAAALPNSFKIESPYPNPFNGSTTIPFDLSSAAEVKLEVFDILGQHVATLVNTRLQAGHYQYTFTPASSHGSGLYFVKLRVDAYSETTKIALLK